MSLNKPVWKLRNWIDEKNLKWYYLSKNPNAISVLEQNTDKIDWWRLSMNENPDAIELLFKSNPDKYKCNILYNSWLIFMNVDNDNDNNNDVYIDIYSVSDGLFYKEDEYETDNKYFYKYLMNIITDKFVIDK